MAAEKIKNKKFTWININKPTRTDTDWLREEYDFHYLDLEDCLGKVQRPQINEYHHYLFFILTWPIYNRDTREISASEVDFFIGNDYLITINDGGTKTVNNFFKEVQNNEKLKESYLNQHPIYLLYEILDRLQNSTLPMLDHVSQDIENIERRIFSGEERKIVKEILHIRRNIVNLRKIMQAHKNIIKKLMATNNKFFMPAKMNVYFSNILDRTKDIWDILETQKENINTFQETNESLISNKLNDIMRILTVISVIMIPANLVASIFGINAQHVPFVGEPFDFYIILSFIFLIMLGFVIYFRQKDWL